MTSLPDFHDGYFDGLYLSEHRIVHLFLRTVDGHGYSVALDRTEALRLSNVRAGNVVLDLDINHQITAQDIQQCYELPEGDTEQIARLLDTSKRDGLVLVEMNSSYGAELTALCAEVHVSAGHFLPASKA